MAFERVSLFSRVEINYSATDAATLQFYTDLPGNEMTARCSPAKTIPATTTRRTLRLILPAGCQGHLLRAEVVPLTGELRLYGMRVRCRTLPDGDWYWFP